MKLYAQYICPDHVAIENKEEAIKAGLVKGQRYEIVSADVYAWSSYVYLKGFTNRFHANVFNITDEHGLLVDICNITAFYRGYEDLSKVSEKLDYSPLNIGLLKLLVDLKKICEEEVPEKGQFNVPAVVYKNSDRGLQLSEIHLSIGYFSKKDAGTLILAGHGLEVPRAEIEKKFGRIANDATDLRYIGLVIIKNDGSNRFIQIGAGDKTYILELLKDKNMLRSLREVILAVLK